MKKKMLIFGGLAVVSLSLVAMFFKGISFLPAAAFVAGSFLVALGLAPEKAGISDDDDINNFIV